MFKKLSSYALRCPCLPDTMAPDQVKTRFTGAKPPRCFTLIGRNGKSTGLVMREDPAHIHTDFLSLQKGAHPREHIAALSRASQNRLRLGAVMTHNGRPQNWVPPEALTHWIAKMAQFAQLEADAKTQEVAEAQEHSLMFLANISHELRTPLNAVIGYADLIRHETFGAVQPAQYGGYIESIHQSGQHLMNSINALLNLAKIDAGAIDLEEERVCVHTLITQGVELIQTEADKLNVKIVTSVPDNFPKLVGDPQLLRQALLNLISNAVKFAPADTVVRITAARTARSGVRITVGDRGPGIPESELPRIVLPFKQAKHGPGRTGVGTGLGLSLAKAFIELHEGRLHLLSQSGRGTRAILTLPSGRVLDERTGAQGGFAFVRQDVLQQKSA